MLARLAIVAVFCTFLLVALFFAIDRANAVIDGSLRPPVENQ
jgi:hypothetical protein